MLNKALQSTFFKAIEQLFLYFCLYYEMFSLYLRKICKS